MPAEGNAGYTRTDDPGEPTTGKPRISITDNEANILSAIAAGKRVIELGTGLGVSTRALARWAPWITTIDVDPWVGENVVPGLYVELFSPTCEFHARRFRDKHADHADVVFIDADHDTESVAKDIEWAESVVVSGGLIVCHDANYDNVKLGLAKSGLDWSHIETEHGLSVARIEGGK